MQLKIGYSTCPNDTYIFTGLSQTEKSSPTTFEPVLSDVETLNQWAFEKRLDVTKLSFFTLGLVQESYGLLSIAGGL